MSNPNDNLAPVPTARQFVEALGEPAIAETRRIYEWLHDHYGMGMGGDLTYDLINVDDERAKMPSAKVETFTREKNRENPGDIWLLATQVFAAVVRDADGMPRGETQVYYLTFRYGRLPITRVSKNRTSSL